MATTKKRPSPAQIAAREAFAARARSGAFKRKGKRKQTPLAFGAMSHPARRRDTNYEQAAERVRDKKPKRRMMKPPSPAQLAARAKFVAMVRAKAKGKKRRNVSGDSSVKSPTRTSSDVRSPTRTATSTEAQTSGNVTVTGGAGRGATTRVDIHTAAPRGTKAQVGKKKNSRGFSGAAPAWTRSKKAKRVNAGRKAYRRATGQKQPWKLRTHKTSTGNLFSLTGGKFGKSSRSFASKSAALRTAKRAHPTPRVKWNPAQRAACRALALRANPGRVRFSEADLAKYAGKIKGLSLVGKATAAPKKRKARRFKKPAGRGLARAFSGSGFLGLGRSRKTVRVNRRLPGWVDAAPRGKGQKSKRRAKKKGLFSSSGFFLRSKGGAHAIRKPGRSYGYGGKFGKGSAGGFDPKRLPNPSPASVFSEFRGKDARSSSRALGSGSGHLTVAQLGKLIELKLTGKRLEFGGRALLCADGRKKLHIGGVRMKHDGQGEDMGEVHSVTYRADKPHIEDGVLDYVHKFGENGGKRPRLIIDHEGYPYLEGGSYKISSDGIIN